MSPKLIVVVVLVAVALAKPPGSKDASEPSLQIIGGHDARPDQFPYQVSLEYKRYDFHFCGGVLLNIAWVLTAGHCGKAAQSQTVVAKAGKLHLREHDSTEQERPVTEIIIHPDYLNGDANSDVCVMKVEPFFDANDHVKGIVYYAAGYTPSGTVTLSGWGRISQDGPAADVLQTADLPIIDYNTCNQMLGDTISPTTICTGSPNGALGPCSGDSGSPLVVYSNGVPVLVGIDSRHVGNCGSSVSMYTSVPAISKWMHETVSSN